MTIKDHLEEETYLPFFFDVVVYDGVESEELKRHIDTKGKVLVDRGMSEWRECKLGEVINLKRGHDLPKRLRHNGNVPIISSSGISGFHNQSKSDAIGVVTGRYGTSAMAFCSGRGGREISSL
jgi:hypothetical protein